MQEPVSRERADLIVRQFQRYEAYFARQGVGRRQFLRMIAMGSAAGVVLPILQACGVASPAEVSQATAKPVAPPASQPTAASQPTSVRSRSARSVQGEDARSAAGDLPISQRAWPRWI